MVHSILHRPVQTVHGSRGYLIYSILICSQIENTKLCTTIPNSSTYGAKIKLKVVSVIGVDTLLVWPVLAGRGDTILPGARLSTIGNPFCAIHPPNSYPIIGMGT